MLLPDEFAERRPPMGSALRCGTRVQHGIVHGRRLDVQLRQRERSVYGRKQAHRHPDDRRWALLSHARNNECAGIAGSGYQVGDVLLFVPGLSATASVRVDAVDMNGVVTAWHFLAYGAYSSIPGTPQSSGTTVGLSGGSGMNFSLWTQWGGQTYSGTITDVSVPGNTITISPTPTYPSGITANPNEWYYGSDDADAINNAIQSFSASGMPGLTIPGNCGVTKQVNGGTQPINNPMLIGMGQASTGLYALGFSLSTTGNTHGTTTVDRLVSAAGVSPGDSVTGPDFVAGTTVQSVNSGCTGSCTPPYVILNQNASGSDIATSVMFVRFPPGHVYNRPSTNNSNSGGGLSNMTVEAMGLTTDAPVEVDGGKEQTFADLWIRNGVGAGNTNLRCGSQLDPDASAGGNWYRNIRAETDSSVLPGALFPDSDIDLDANCHDSFLVRAVAVNATVANILHARGGSLHIDNPHTFNDLFPDVPGSADYGIATAQSDYIVGPQADDANFADFFLAPSDHQASFGQRLIEAHIGCAAGTAPAPFTLNTTGTVTGGSAYVTNVTTVAGASAGMIVYGFGIPLGDRIVAITGSGTSFTIQLSSPATGNGTQITIIGGFRGIEISSGDYNATVTATEPGNNCTLAPSAVVQQDGTADPPTAVFANGSASYSTMHSVYGSMVYSTQQFLGSASLSGANIYHACMNTSAEPATVHLPNPAMTGLQYTVDDCGGHANVNHIMIVSTGSTIDGQATLNITTAYGSWTGYYTGSMWKTVASH